MWQSHASPKQGGQIQLNLLYKTQCGQINLKIKFHLDIYSRNPLSKVDLSSRRKTLKEDAWFETFRAVQKLCFFPASSASYRVSFSQTSSCSNDHYLCARIFFLTMKVKSCVWMFFFFLIDKTCLFMNLDFRKIQTNINLALLCTAH